MPMHLHRFEAIGHALGSKAKLPGVGGEGDLNCKALRRYKAQKGTKHKNVAPLTFVAVIF